MKYDVFKSIVNSCKQPIDLGTTTESFYMRTTRVTPYIEPSFSKIEFPVEKPAILLVSAVGASGKTTTAQVLSFDTRLPILDLARHKAVGDNTLTGILTSAYPIEKVGTVLQGIRTGTHGIIIDGIDEARSKTTEQGFEAFLDDLIERSKGSPSPVIVVFGRGQVLLSTWCYLLDREADVGLAQIDPFDLEQAKSYIDASANEHGSIHQINYEQARDGVLSRLSAAFQPLTSASDNTFLSFIGYPPVLDAIATLLRTERNYYRIQQALTDGTGGQLEIELLIRISDYLLNREHDEKALPNFVNAIAADAGPTLEVALKRDLFNKEEQCARLLSRALGRPFPRRVIENAALNERYEESVAAFCPDHPFLSDTHIRNAVFAAVVITRCALSNIPEYQSLALDYVGTIRPTYHLLFIMSELVKDSEISIRYFNMLMQSCSEFLGLNAEISIDLDGESWDEEDQKGDSPPELAISIEFPQRGQERLFRFKGVIDSDGIQAGPYLINVMLTLPCRVNLSGAPAVEAIGECVISAPFIQFDTPDMIVRSIRQRMKEASNADSELFVNARRVEGHADAVSSSAGNITIQCVEHNLAYPLAKYVHRVPPPIADQTLREKYRRLRRILSEFRSHSRGNLGKFRDKIEHERVLRNQTGRDILEALVKDGILTRDQRMYYIDPENCDNKLGVSWNQLRQYGSSDRLEAFLRGIG